MLTKQANTEEYELLRQKIANCFTKLSNEYSFLTNQTKVVVAENILFACKIINLLLAHIDIINHGSLLAKQSLIELLETNLKIYNTASNTYTEALQNIKEFEAKVATLIDNCTDDKPSSLRLNSQELDLVGNQATDLLEKCQISLCQELSSDTVYQIQASAIAYNIFSLSLKCQRQLQDKLMMIKELWYIDNYIDKNHKFLLKFNTEPNQALASFKSSDVDAVFAYIILMLTQDSNLLHDLDDEKLIELYDRLKNIEPQSINIRSVLSKVHAEAKFRYEHSRLSDTEYELLKRFQNLDAIIHQIENTEFSLTESYLLRKETFLHELVLAISKHLDNIRAVEGQKQAKINAVISDLEQLIKEKAITEHIIIATMSLIKSSLKIKFDIHAYRRYAELDKFAAFTINTKYNTLFDNMLALLKDSIEDSKDFLQNSICRKFACDFHAINPANSSLKLRTIISERTNIMQQLSKINFVDIFSLNYINNITSLNLTKQLKSNNSISANDYIEHVIQNLLSNASSQQLSILHNLIANSKEAIHNIVRGELTRQINTRTTLAKLIYLIVTGKKHEYDELRIIQIDLQNADSVDINN